MATGEATRRVQFTLPAALVDAIDRYCEMAHMSRSTFVEYTLASSINSTERLLEGVTSKMTASVVEEGADA